MWLAYTCGSHGAFRLPSLRESYGGSAGALAQAESRKPRSCELFAQRGQFRLAATADRGGKGETFEPPIERPPAQAAPLGGRPLVAGSRRQRAREARARDGRPPG